MKHFGTLWENLTVHVENLQAHTPRITKDVPINKWVETLEDHLYRSIGGRKILLVYAVRILVNTDQPYSEESGPLDENLIACTSHDRGLFPK